ncbi:MAG: hypothetical protein ACLPIX_03180 [Rhodomicrobium sp.]
MIRSTVLALFIVASAAAPAMACMEPPESTHQREIYLLDKGIETFKLDAPVLAKAKELRDRAVAAFKARKLREAWEARHSALLQIGYKVETAPAGENGAAIAPGSPPLAKALPTRGLAPHGCGGGGTVWVPPAE